MTWCNMALMAAPVSPPRYQTSGRSRAQLITSRYRSDVGHQRRSHVVLCESHG